MEVFEIRPEKDRDHIIDLANKHNSIMGMKELNVEKTIRFFDMMFSSFPFVGFRSESGYIIGFVIPDPMRDVLILREFGWYSEDGSGIKLLKAYIAKAKELEVDEIEIVCAGDHWRLPRVLQSMGFTNKEKIFVLNN